MKISIECAPEELAALAEKKQERLCGNKVLTEEDVKKIIVKWHLETYEIARGSARFTKAEKTATCDTQPDTL